MSTTETVRAWSTTAATNASSDAAISSSDSQSPDTLDNNVRSIMVGVRKQEDDTGGKLAAGGTANALTVTTGQVLESGQLVAGLRLLLRATADNTSATVTFAPDGLTAANVKRADGSALAVGSIKSGMYLDLVYNTGSSEWRCANIAPININIGSPGMILLASGSVLAAATLDLVLTSYTAYRGLKFFLSAFKPVSDADTLNCRLSTDGGSTYVSSANYQYAYRISTAAAVQSEFSGTGSSFLNMATTIGNATSEGLDIEITMQNQASTFFWTRLTWIGDLINSSATPVSAAVVGGGALALAQDTDAIRFAFSSGNINSGNYAVYGLV